jgi:hypothetical protein
MHNFFSVTSSRFGGLLQQLKMAKRGEKFGQSGRQGCQTVYFHTKNSKLDIYVLEGLTVENFGINLGKLI